MRQNLSMHDVLRLMEYWKQYPPLHVLIAGYLGYGHPKRRSQPLEETMTALASCMGPAQKPPAYVQDLVSWVEKNRPHAGKT